MYFSTDQQTLDDLNIFGKPGTESIYSMFNRTYTIGGAEILAEMFRSPLSDIDAINNRSRILQYFTNAGASFPFDRELFDLIEFYLDNTDERSKLVANSRSLGQKISHLISADPEYKTIYKGVISIVAVLQQLSAFLKSIKETSAGNAYVTEINAMAALLERTNLNDVLTVNSKRNLSFSTVAELDKMLRFKSKDVLKSLLHYIYRLDVYISIAKVAAERRFCYAIALPGEDHTVELNGVYHPHVKNAKPNTLTIDPAGNLIFLTGANMAGKSTLMKSLGIALFLAHMGFPVAAETMAFSVRDGIYTTINLADNLGMGESHFYAEVLRVKKVAHELNAGKTLFVIFDELFRGTNVKDAYEATIAIAGAFASRKQSMFVISTHIMEAGEILSEKYKTIRFIYLPTKMEGNCPVYTYTLEEGITADRQGMIIINNEGIIELLTQGIKKVSAHDEVYSG